MCQTSWIFLRSPSTSCLHKTSFAEQEKNKIITKIPISGNSDTNREESTRDISKRSRVLCQDDIRSRFPRRRDRPYALTPTDRLIQHTSSHFVSLARYSTSDNIVCQSVSIMNDSSSRCGPERDARWLTLLCSPLKISLYLIWSIPPLDYLFLSTEFPKSKVTGLLFYIAIDNSSITPPHVLTKSAHVGLKFSKTRLFQCGSAASLLW